VGIIECFRAEFLRRPSVVSQSRGAWILGYVREHRLYTLAVAQLSDRLAGPIYMGGGIKHPIVILEVVASYDRWI
jgi:hypothetical protein